MPLSPQEENTMATTHNRTDGVDFTYEDDLVTATDCKTGVATGSG